MDRYNVWAEKHLNNCIETDERPTPNAIPTCEKVGYKLKNGQDLYYST